MLSLSIADNYLKVPITHELANQVSLMAFLLYLRAAALNPLQAFILENKHIKQHFIFFF